MRWCGWAWGWWCLFLLEVEGLAFVGRCSRLLMGIFAIPDVIPHYCDVVTVPDEEVHEEDDDPVSLVP